jgi:hypothetical protein
MSARSIVIQSAARDLLLVILGDLRFVILSDLRFVILSEAKDLLLVIGQSHRETG